MILSEPPAEFTPSGFDFEFASPSDYARLYRLRGIQVVPAFMPGEPPGDTPEKPKWKRPLFDSWKEFQEALVSDEVFVEWYGPNGKYALRPNMGVITGRASNTFSSRFTSNTLSLNPGQLTAFPSFRRNT